MLPASAQPATDTMPPYRSFWMAGFEGADHRNAHGTPLDLVQSNGHLEHLERTRAAGGIGRERRDLVGGLVDPALHERPRPARALHDATQCHAGRTIGSVRGCLGERCKALARISGCGYVGLGVLAALSPGSSSSAHELMQ